LLYLYRLLFIELRSVKILTKVLYLLLDLILGSSCFRSSSILRARLIECFRSWCSCITSLGLSRVEASIPRLASLILHILWHNWQKIIKVIEIMIVVIIYDRWSLCSALSLILASIWTILFSIIGLNLSWLPSQLLFRIPDIWLWPHLVLLLNLLAIDCIILALAIRSWYILQIGIRSDGLLMAILIFGFVCLNLMHIYIKNKIKINC